MIMFDLKTFKVLARIHAAEDADAIVYDAPSDRVFTLNGDAHSLDGNRPRGGEVDYKCSPWRQTGIWRYQQVMAWFTQI